MNRIDRLFAILLQLQARRQVHVKQLSKILEVSERTIYRDIAALSQMGVPIITEWGEGFELQEGYYLPPLLFTREEAILLVLGAKMLALQSEGHFPQVAEYALAKILTSLPKHLRPQVEQKVKLIEFFAPQYRFNLDDTRIVTIQDAIHNQQVIKIHYHSHSRNEITERQIEPYSLMYSEGVWYVNGYCRLREAFRQFRVNRMNIIEVKTEKFAPRPIIPESQPIVEIRVRFDGAIIRWVYERQHYSFQQTETLGTSQDLVMIYRPNTFDEFKPWLLSWGAYAEILSPREFRDQLREEVVRLAKVLT